MCDLYTTLENGEIGYVSAIPLNCITYEHTNKYYILPDGYDFCGIDRDVWYW